MQARGEQHGLMWLSCGCAPLCVQKKGKGTDAFAPEFTMDTWYDMTGVTGSRGLEHLISGAKNNPNERRLTRSNRRRK